MFVLNDLLDFFIICNLKDSLVETGQEASYKFSPHEDAPGVL